MILLLNYEWNFYAQLLCGYINAFSLYLAIADDAVKEGAVKAGATDEVGS